MEKSKLIDISLPSNQDLTLWPGDPGFHLEQLAAIDSGKDFNLSRIKTGLHTGTHIDAPLHFIKDGLSIDEIPAELFWGVCRVVEVRPPGRLMRPSDLDGLVPDGTRRLLIKTPNSEFIESGEFVSDYTALNPAAAFFLVKQGVELLGIDYLSIGPFGEMGFEVHRAYLGNGTRVALEGINLGDVEPGEYELICQPLKIEGAEASPVRALLKSMDS